MTLILREADVRRVLTVPECVGWLEEAFKAYAVGQARNISRARVKHPGGTLHVLPAADLAADAVGLKAYTSGRSGTRFSVLLYRASSGELLAILEADYLGQVRTGSASGVATKYLAREDARRLGVYGGGRQATSQVAAVAAVRPLEQITVWSRTPEHREQFAAQMSKDLGVPARAASAPEEAARGQDIVVTITTARDPVLQGEWLEPGTHVNAAGSNSLLRRELDDAAVQRADLVVVDSRQQARIEAGDLLSPAERGIVEWDQLVELADVVAGTGRRRTSRPEITLFESQGLGLEDVAVAMRVYEKARAEGIGQEIELFSEVKARPGRQ
ncbi:MAG TPA: ornithine cyclodeaminase family protein [Chloroflexota bacterium]|jgi:ornithine cyclodeaminase/alanine dehydrogenase-like protein (mu-crystallin family)